MTENQIERIRETDADPTLRWNALLALSDRRALLAEVERLRGLGQHAPDPRPVSRLGALLGRLPERLRWIPHNVVAHPLSEVLYQLGLRGWSDTVHDATIPAHAPGTGRG